MTTKNDTDIAKLIKDIEYIGKDVTDIKLKLDSNYATKEWVNSEYGNQKKLVNGLVTFVLIEFLTALSGLIFLLKK